MDLFSGECSSPIDMNDNKMKSIKNELVQILQLNDEPNQDSIIIDVLNNGRQALIKYESDIVPDIYENVMNNENNELMTSLKKFFKQKWEIQYGSSHQWFVSFLKQYEIGENVEVYQRVLKRTAEYGNRFIKHSPLLSIVIQLVFEDIADNELLTAKLFDDRYLNGSNPQNENCSGEINSCDELWFSITNDGLTSMKKYPEYIVEDIMSQQLDKTQSTLFQALREYYKPQLFLLLKTNDILNRENLYESLLENVAESGWLAGLQKFQRKLTPKSYEKLSKSVNSFLEELKAQKQKAQQQAIQKSEEEQHIRPNNETSNNIQLGTSQTNLTAASSEEIGN